MKKEHPHAQFFRWTADGEDVQFQMIGENAWHPLEDLSQEDYFDIFTGANGFTFRIKPKTIRIGDREIEAPVMSGPGYFITEFGTMLEWFGDETDNDVYRHFQRCGRVFATPEAARAAQEAITALLTREPS